MQNYRINRVGIVGGCGHVGLPLGIAMADRGFDVTLLDLNPVAVDQINRGALPFLEEGAEPVLKTVLSAGNLRASTDRDSISNADVLIFVTGTPVDEHLNPKFQDVVQVIKSYLPLIQDKLVILRSTVYPGTVDLIHTLIESSLGKARLAFCPERIVQGKGIAEIYQLPQIISATTAQAEEDAAEIFSRLSPKLLHLQPMEAELAKLITNSWRYLEFAIANQFYMMVESQGLDFYRVFAGITADYPRAAHFPKPGLAAGPCLFKDTMQLASFHNNQFHLGHTGMLVNEGLPSFLVNQLEKKMGLLKQKKIAILGMTFKPNNDDTRESLSFKLRKLLQFKMADVLCCDPYIQGSTTVEQAMMDADGFIIGVPHREYLKLKISKPVVDCWGVWNSSDLNQFVFQSESKT